MKNINIAEILKNYPKGTKLYSPICGECELEVIQVELEDEYYHPSHPIRCTQSNGCNINFDKYGRVCDSEQLGECLLFPSKNCRDWDTMKVTEQKNPTKSGIFEFEKIIDNMSDEELNEKLDNFESQNSVGPKADEYLKFLEENKLEFKKGDILKDSRENIFICRFIGKTHIGEFLGSAFCVLFKDCTMSTKEWLYKDYLIDFATEEERQRLLKAIDDNGYIWDTDRLKLREKPHKFKPFEKVLVRNYEKSIWKCDMFSTFDSINKIFVCVGNFWNYCIPYEGNEHLLGTANKPE